MNTADAVSFWDDVHASRPATTGPRPNTRLTEIVTDLDGPAGTASAARRGVPREPHQADATGVSPVGPSDLGRGDAPTLGRDDSDEALDLGCGTGGEALDLGCGDASDAGRGDGGATSDLGRHAGGDALDAGGGAVRDALDLGRGDALDVGRGDGGATSDVGCGAGGDALDAGHGDGGETPDAGRGASGGALDVGHGAGGETPDLGRGAGGDALDLGCGDGGDALWLARQGWHVTAVDISAVAVERLAALARSQGLADRITAVRHDLGRAFPRGEYDLICAHYLHTPFDLDRTAVLRSAAHALRAGGRLLVVDHGSTAPWSWNQDPDTRYPTPEEVAADIDLDPATWTVERAETPRRTATGPGGRTAEVTDHVLLIRRIA